MNTKKEGIIGEKQKRNNNTMYVWKAMQFKRANPELQREQLH